ncbi:hypothetical protein [Streptomyces crystallinus]|uniref:Uncharacterized protein n=1 Tax=Streptomyces crystallinus TaxID=68191 RepID=A0ABN1FTT1_9ACTN
MAHSPSTPPQPLTPEWISTHFDSLPFPARMPALARYARTLAPDAYATLHRALDAGDQDERHTGLFLAVARRDLDTVAAALGDPLLRRRALAAAIRLPVPEEPLAALVLSDIRAVRHSAYRVLRLSRRHGLADRLLPEVYERHGAQEAARLLIACSPGTVGRWLPRTDAPPGVLSTLARTAPAAVAALLTKEYGERATGSQAYRYAQGRRALAGVVAERDPAAGLSLLRHAPRLIGEQAAVALLRRPAELLDVLRSLRSLAPVQCGEVSVPFELAIPAGPLPPAAVAALRTLSEHDLAELATRCRAVDGHLRAPGRQKVAADPLLALLPPAVRRRLVAERAGDDTGRRVPLAALAALEPADRAEFSDARLERWKRRPVHLIAVAVSLPLAAAEPILREQASQHRIHQRVFAWPALLACAELHGDPDEFARIVLSCERAWHDQEEVRRYALRQLAGTAPRLLAALPERVLRDTTLTAVQSRDSTAETLAAAASLLRRTTESAAARGDRARAATAALLLCQVVTDPRHRGPGRPLRVGVDMARHIWAAGSLGAGEVDRSGLGVGVGAGLASGLWSGDRSGSRSGSGAPSGERAGAGEPPSPSESGGRLGSGAWQGSGEGAGWGDGSVSEQPAASDDWVKPSEPLEPSEPSEPGSEDPALRIALAGLLASHLTELPDADALMRRTALTVEDPEAAAHAAAVWIAPAHVREERCAQLVAEDPSFAAVPEVLRTITERRTDLLAPVLAAAGARGDVRGLRGRVRPRGGTWVLRPRTGAIGRWRPKDRQEWYETLAAATTDNRAPMRVRADAASHLRSPAHLHPLTEHAPQPIAAAALTALGESGPATPELLATLLRHAGTGGVRGRAAVASVRRLLAEEPDGDVIELLTPLLNSPATPVGSRKEAARTLGVLGGEDAGAALLAAWDEPHQHRDVRAAIAPFLLRLADRDDIARRLLEGAREPAIRDAVITRSVSSAAYITFLARLVRESDDDTAAAACATLAGRVAGNSPAMRDAARALGEAAIAQGRPRRVWHAAIAAVVGIASTAEADDTSGAAEAGEVSAGRRSSDALSYVLNHLVDTVKSSSSTEDVRQEALRRLAGCANAVSSGYGSPVQVRRADAMATALEDAGLLREAARLALDAAWAALRRGDATPERWVKALRLLDDHPGRLPELNSFSLGSTPVRHPKTTLRTARMLRERGTPTAGLLAVALVQTAGARTGWSAPWRTELSALRRHADPDTAMAALLTESVGSG